MKKGAFVISLDFELYWGIGDHIDYNTYKGYFDATIESIPEQLKLFETYNIHATWATVGMLWNRDWETWKTNQPSRIPKYTNKRLSNYYLGEEINKDSCDTSHFFATELIQKIRSTVGQELGSHTYSHYYCNETNPIEQAFEYDLLQAVSMLGPTESPVESLVFPRNQFVGDTLRIVKEKGFTSVRTNPDVWYWELKNINRMSSRIARLIDAYFSIFKMKSHNWDALKMTAGVLKQPASRFLRPPGSSSFFNKIRIVRIKKEMSHAAKHGHLYHLWWHPHNFAGDSKLSLKELESILQHYNSLKSRYGMISMSMKEVTQYYKQYA